MAQSSKEIEQWCKKMTKDYEGVQIKDFEKSWRNGLALCAIIHKMDPSLFDFSALKKEDMLENNRMAFETVERRFGITSELRAEDMLFSPDRQKLLNYLSQIQMHYRFNRASLSPQKSIPGVEELAAKPGKSSGDVAEHTEKDFDQTVDSEQCRVGESTDRSNGEQLKQSLVDGRLRLPSDVSNNDSSGEEELERLHIDEDIGAENTTADAINREEVIDEKTQATDVSVINKEDIIDEIIEESASRSESVRSEGKTETKDNCTRALHRDSKIKVEDVIKKQLKDDSHENVPSQTPGSEKAPSQLTSSHEVLPGEHDAVDGSPRMRRNRGPLPPLPESNSRSSTVSPKHPPKRPPPPKKQLTPQRPPPPKLKPPEKPARAAPEVSSYPVDMNPFGDSDDSADEEAVEAQQEEQHTEVKSREDDKPAADEYPDDLNPFGDDETEDDEDVAVREQTEATEDPMPVMRDQKEPDASEGKSDDMRPADATGVTKSAVDYNPFEISDDEVEEEVMRISSANETSTNTSLTVPIGTPSASPLLGSRKSMKAPQAPRPVTPVGGRYKKPPAPLPPPVRREVHGSSDVAETNTDELKEKLAKLEQQRIEIDKRSRELETQLPQARCAEGKEEELLLKDWFEVVSQRIDVNRQHSDVKHTLRELELEREHSDIEFQLRRIMSLREHEKTPLDAQQEAQLLERLVGVVEQRDAVVVSRQNDIQKFDDETIELEKTRHSKCPSPKMSPTSERNEPMVSKKKKKKSLFCASSKSSSVAGKSSKKKKK